MILLLLFYTSITNIATCKGTAEVRTTATAYVTATTTTTTT